MKNQRGFTLLELMVAVAMIAIVASMAMPSWREVVANRRTAGASREIYNALQHTRMKAIKEGKTITVTYTDREETPLTDATGASPREFQKALISWDEDGDGTVDIKEEIFEAPKDIKNIKCDTNQNTMAYNSRGILLATNSGTVRTWSGLTKREYSVVLNNLGTLRQATGKHTESATEEAGGEGGAGEEIGVASEIGSIDPEGEAI